MTTNDLIMALMRPSNDNPVMVLFRNETGEKVFYEACHIYEVKEHVVIVIDHDINHTIDDL